MNWNILKMPQVLAFVITGALFSVIMFKVGDIYGGLGLAMASMFLMFTMGYLEKIETARENFLFALLWVICVWFLYHAVSFHVDVFLVLASGTALYFLIASVVKYLGFNVVS